MKTDIAIYTAYDGFKVHDAAEAEKNLMRAILHTAMEDYKKGGQFRKDAHNYFRNTGGHLYSFTSICKELELCPETIKKVIGFYSDSRSSVKSDN